jgi:hypothetical protein
MFSFPNISVVIPSNHGHHELLHVVRTVCGQTVKPFEIVIVDSADERGICPSEIKALCADSKIKLTYEQRESSMPGDARNIGLGLAEGEIIAFIDVQTIPKLYWLEAAVSLLGTHRTAGVFGATCFIAEKRFERLVRDGFYGLKPRRTLPGSVFRREVFFKTGQFIDWVRAGEDTDWILRLELLKIPVAYPSVALVDYVGLIGTDMKQLMKKWYRNYNDSRELPHFFPQKLLVWLVLYPLLVLIAFNWNYLVADWRMESPLYLGHVTKFVAILPGVTYVIVRGLILPYRRGVSICRLLPLRFLAITVICLLGDFVKVLVFSSPKRRHVDSEAGLKS